MQNDFACNSCFGFNLTDITLEMWNKLNFYNDVINRQHNMINLYILKSNIIYKKAQWDIKT